MSVPEGQSQAQELRIVLGVRHGLPQSEAHILCLMLDLLKLVIVEIKYSCYRTLFFLCQISVIKYF